MSNRSFADIRALKKPNEVSIQLVMDAELVRTMAELEKRLFVEKRKDERENRPAQAPEIQKKLDGLVDQLEAAKVNFIFKDPGRQKFEDLVEACPPTPAEKKKAKEEGQSPPSWDSETFVPGLLALASLEPELSLEDAREIYDQWGRGDVEALFNTALQACLEQASIPFTKRDTEEILASVQKSIIAQSEEFPTAGS